MERLTTIARRIAIIGVTGTFLAINTIPILLNNQIRESKPYKLALQLLSSHPEAVKSLGTPIRALHINVTQRENYGTDDKKMWLKVPVKGPNDKGILYYEFYKDKCKGDFCELSIVELTVDKYKDYKLVIKKPD